MGHCVRVEISYLVVSQLRPLLICDCEGVRDRHISVLHAAILASTHRLSSAFVQAGKILHAILILKDLLAEASKDPRKEEE